MRALPSGVASWVSALPAGSPGCVRKQQWVALQSGLYLAGRECLAQNNMNSSLKWKGTNGLQSEPGLLPGPHPPQQDSVPLGVRLHTASGTSFKTLAEEEVQPDSRHVDKQLSLPFETEGSQAEMLSNLTSWRKGEAALGCCSGPRGMSSHLAQDLPRREALGDPQASHGYFFIISFSLLLPKLSESAGSPGSWAVLTAATLWLKGQLGPSTFPSGACVGISLSKSRLAGDCRSQIILPPWPTFPSAPFCFLHSHLFSNN